MGTTFGVNVGDRMAEEIEARRSRRDADGETEIVSRSQVVRELLRIGLAADGVLDEADLEIDRGRPREAFVRQAVIDQLDREGFDTEEL